MITACLLIIAWTASLPLWASITITVIAGVRFWAEAIKLLVQFMGECNRD